MRKKSMNMKRTEWGREGNSVGGRKASRGGRHTRKAPSQGKDEGLEGRRLCQAMQTAAWEVRSRSSLPTPEQCLLSAPPPHAELPTRRSMIHLPSSPLTWTSGWWAFSLLSPGFLPLLQLGDELWFRKWNSCSERKQGGCSLRTQGPSQKARWLLQAYPKMPSSMNGGPKRCQAYPVRPGCCSFPASPPCTGTSEQGSATSTLPGWNPQPHPWMPCVPVKENTALLTKEPALPMTQGKGQRDGIPGGGRRDI